MFNNQYGFESNGFTGFGFGVPHILMIVGIILTMFAIVYFVTKAIQNIGSNMAYAKIPLSAVDILDERFANGEISEEEYRVSIDQLLR